MKGYDLIINRDTDKAENHLIISEVVKEVPENSLVLDVGCNSGWLMQELIKKGCTCYGIDASEIPLKVAREKGLNVLLADAQNIPFKSDYFDVVTIVSVLQQMARAEYQKSLYECFRVLKKGGNLIGVNATPEGEWGFSAIDKSPYVHLVIPRSDYAFTKDISTDNYLFIIEKSNVI